jgi:outer membrane receptor for ferrienterochelin and colicin
MRKCLFVTGILLLQITRVHAGTVGILMGTVVEKESGRALAGANVVLLGTQMGAAADVEGKFVIYNIPAGLYTVKITVIGYRTHIIKNVRIIQDHKTKLVIELQQEAIAGEEVIVIATRPLIQPDLTSSIHFVSKKEIDHLPINSFEEIMELQPGVVSGGHIRGGRATEVLYLIDGIPVQQSIEGGLGADVPKGALEEITLQTGGFNAEYGNAMSGILNITTPSGSEQHRVWLRAVDDRLGWKESNKWRQYELFGSGPLYGTKASYFISSDLTLSDTRWWQDMQKAFDSPNNKNFNLISKINIAFSPGERLVLQGIYSWWDQRQYEYRWRYNLNGLPPIKKNSLRLSAVFTQMLSPMIFYTISLSRFQVNNLLGQGNKNEVNPDQIFQYDLPWYYFITSGNRLWWQDSKEVTYYAKFDFTHQMSDIWQIKFGAEGQYFDLHNEIVKYEPQKTFWGRPILEAVPFNFNTRYDYQPWLGACYFQTKVDNKFFAANVGIRWDVFDPRAQRPIIEWIPVTGKDFRSQINGFVAASRKSQLSPRIGFSFPILEKNFFFFSFGHFFQIPLFDYLYTGLNTEFLKKGVRLLYGNPDLKPEHTKAYEFSYKHLLGKEVAASVTYFKKSIINLVDTKTFLASDSKSEDDGFSQFVNLSYANSSGIEVTVEKQYNQYFSGKLSYTYMTAKGYSGNAEQGMNYFTWGFEVPNREYYLSWDQRHTIAADLFAGDPEKYGMNIVWRWHSPRPYTYYPSRDGVVPDRAVRIEPNNARMFNVAYLDVKMSRSFWLKKNIEATLYFDYRNIFDRFNVLWIASDGKIGGELGDPTAYDQGRRFYLGVKIEFDRNR